MAQLYQILDLRHWTQAGQLHGRHWDCKVLVLWLCRMFFLLCLSNAMIQCSWSQSTVATCQRMRSRWFPRLPLPGVDVVSTFDIAFGEPGWAAAAKACLSSDSVWYEQKSHGSLIKTTTSVMCLLSKLRVSAAHGIFLRPVQADPVVRRVLDAKMHVRFLDVEPIEASTWNLWLSFKIAPLQHLFFV